MVNVILSFSHLIIHLYRVLQTLMTLDLLYNETGCEIRVRLQNLIERNHERQQVQELS